MFSGLARLRLLPAALLFSANLSFAHLDKLYTSSVSYCSPPETVLVQQLDLAYIRHNNSISFNVSAQSVENNLNASLNIFLNVYGSQPINITVDICTLLSGALCPLPVYDFDGADSITIPSSIDISSFIPTIAYKIPDLEAFAQLSLIDTSTGETKVCIQVTVANGWSTLQPAVSWTTAAVALLALLSAAWQSLLPEPLLAPFRLLDLIALYQLVAFSALLDLDYPVVYRSFALNFSWAIGLFFQTDSSIQNSIDNMRHLTGGTLDSSAGAGSVALVNRALSPYNVGGTSSDFVSSLSTRSFADDVLAAIMPTSLDLSSLLSTTAAKTTPHLNQVVQTVTEDSDNVLEAGIPIYASSTGIATADAFMTIFFVSLILGAIIIAALAIFYGVLILFIRRPSSPAWAHDIRARYPVIIRQWGLRVALVCFAPVVTFAFYQWTLDDSWLSILIAVISFLAVMGGIGWPSYAVFRSARRSSPDALSHEVPEHEPLYGHYRVSRWYFFILPLFGIFVRSLVIAFGHASGTTQIVFFVIVDFFLLLATCVFKPNKTKRADVLTIFLAVVRLVCTGLLIAFLQSLNVGAIPRVAIGIVAAVIFSVTVVIMFLNIIWNMGLRRLWNARRFRSLESKPVSPSGSLHQNDHAGAEKADVEEKAGSRQRQLPPSASTQETYGEEIPSRYNTSHSGHSHEQSVSQRSESEHSSVSPRHSNFQQHRTSQARDSYFQGGARAV